MVRISAKPATINTKGFSLGVSVGSPNHKDAVLAGVVDWINQSQFEYGIIDLSDTLHRFTLMAEGMNATAAHNAARAMGDQWLSEQRPILQDLRKPVRVIHWDDWLNDLRLPSIKAEVRAAIDASPNLRQAMYADISHFYARNGVQPSQEQVQLSMQYFTEEMTVHTLLHRDHNVTSIYPGKQLEAYKLIRQKRAEFPDGIPGSSYVRLMPHSLPDIAALPNAANILRA